MKGIQIQARVEFRRLNGWGGVRWDVLGCCIERKAQEGEEAKQQQQQLGASFGTFSDFLEI